MAEKKLEELPPAYSNLGYDDESEAGPSAPTSHISPSDKDEDESGAVPSAPTIHASPIATGIQQGSAQPTAPPALPVELNLGPPPMVYNFPSLVFEDIYDACVGYVKSNCCYGSRFINRMKLTEITNKAMFHYKLESFGEKRESKIVTIPYKGGAYDGPENGPSPDPWDISARAPHLFKDCSVQKTIPHTTTIHICFKCDGVGKVECYRCSGRGYEDCSRCNGRGQSSDEDGGRCTSCSGSGTQQCSRCSGSGKVTCSKCDGYGKVQKYKALIVTWKNHPLDFVTMSDNLPQELIIKAEGTTLFVNADFALEPIQNAPDVTVNAASVSMLQSHRRSFPSEMIIRQRHILRGIPFTRVQYQWKEREGEFYVYGNNREVYFDVYPQRCCCCTCC